MLARASMVALMAAVAVTSPQDPPGPPPPRGTLFADDFESGLGRWEVLGESGASVRPGDPAHGHVLVLDPNGDDVAALIRGSETWSSVRLEGQMLFPTAAQSYLGLVYHHTTRAGRRDFGLIYVKGNDSYLQLNPHRDLNVSRLIYPEFHVPLSGPAAVRVGAWQQFAVEVQGRTAHVYVGGTPMPQLTFGGLELESGTLGLQPRSVGGPVWVDNIRVTPLERLSYGGTPRPNAAYMAGDLLTRWQVAGPFTETDDRIGQSPRAASVRWMPFDTDWRGAVVTARVVDFHGPRRVAYFRTSVAARSAGRATLEISSIDDLAVWANGAFLGFYARQPPAWFDFHRNPDHAGRSIPVELIPGTNEIVLRVIGGVYASGGFFARLAPAAGGATAAPPS